MKTQWNCYQLWFETNRDVLGCFKTIRPQQLNSLAAEKGNILTHKCTTLNLTTNDTCNAEMNCSALSYARFRLELSPKNCQIIASVQRPVKVYKLYNICEHRSGTVMTKWRQIGVTDGKNERNRNKSTLATTWVAWIFFCSADPARSYVQWISKSECRKTRYFGFLKICKSAVGNSVFRAIRRNYLRICVSKLWLPSGVESLW